NTKMNTLKGRIEQLSGAFDTMKKTIADDVDTIGGWIMVQKQIVAEGDIIEKHGFYFKVLEKDMHQIKRVEIRKVEE
ncbi:transporter associated domain-containing protein, partial [Bacillus sp. SS-TM]